MTYFDKYVSNTCAGSGNQMFFNMNEDEVRTGRMFYKIFAGGEYNYSILFSNIIDTTFSNGAVSHVAHVAQGTVLCVSLEQSFCWGFQSGS